MLRTTRGLRATHLVIICYGVCYEKAIEKEELGKDDITDFLTVSFSTDYVGHY
jgi:hypothetical protein